MRHALEGPAPPKGPRLRARLSGRGHGSPALHHRLWIKREKNGEVPTGASTGPVSQHRLLCMGACSAFPPSLYRHVILDPSRPSSTLRLLTSARPRSLSSSSLRNCFSRKLFSLFFLPWAPLPRHLRDGDANSWEGGGGWKQRHRLRPGPFGKTVVKLLLRMHYSSPSAFSLPRLLILTLSASVSTSLPSSPPSMSHLSFLGSVFPPKCLSWAAF